MKSTNGIESKKIHISEEENWVWPDHTTFKKEGDYLIAMWPVYKSHMSLTRMKKQLGGK